MPDLKQPVEAAMALAKDESTRLGLTFGTQKVTPGQHIPKGDAKSAPELSFNGATGTYIVLGIDLDVPFPSFSVLGNQPGLKPQPAADGTTSLVAGDAPFISDYAGPGPPPLSAPHRYVFLLYDHPDGFDSVKFAPPDGKKMGMRPRMKYDLRAFGTAAKLGPVVACNYFVSN
ncbi:putative protease inhibitor [Halenospora varia]|nr:putative protease inhibitor [Halenospora varia]